MRLRTAATVAAALIALGSCTGDAGTVEVRDAWARDTAPSQTSAALYFTVANPGESAFRITTVKVPARIARTTTLHRSMQTGTGEHDMATMRPVESVRVAAHSDVTFAPGGLHVMMEELRRPLHSGDHFTMTLERTSGTPLRAEVTVRTS